MRLIERAKYTELTRAHASNIDDVAQAYEDQIKTIGQGHAHLEAGCKSEREHALRCLAESLMWARRALSKTQKDRQELAEALRQYGEQV